MTQPTLTPGTQVEIRPGAASAWGRKFPDGGQATVLATAVDDDLVGQEIYVLPDGDPSHNTLRMRVEDLTPVEAPPTLHLGIVSAPALEVTPAVRRLAEKQFREYGSEYSTDGMSVAEFYDTARSDLAVAFDGEEIARQLCEHTGPAAYHGPVPCDEHSLAVAVVRDVMLGGNQGGAARRDEIVGDGS